MLNMKLKETIESTMTAEERAFAMEQLLKEEEARIHQVEKELARLREIQVCWLLCDKCKIPWLRCDI